MRLLAKDRISMKKQGEESVGEKLKNVFEDNTKKNLPVFVL